MTQQETVPSALPASPPAGIFARLRTWLASVLTTLALYKDRNYADAVRRARTEPADPYEFGTIDEE